MPKDFRHVLRHETQVDHARVDAALSALDVSDRDGLADFLKIHLTCFEIMHCAAAKGSRAALSLQRMCSAIERDLSVLADTHRIPETKSLGAIDPVAIDYLIEGSRLGTIVLKRRWDISQDPEVCAAGAYFALQPETGRWQEVCSTLSAIPTASARASTIKQNTRDLFGLFWSVSQQYKAKIQTEETLTNDDA